MPKTTPEDYINLGFTAAMFKQETDEVFKQFIGFVISEQAPLLEGRVGTTAYNSTSSPTKYYVKRAELCLTAEELVQRRINIILGNVVGAGHEIDISHEGAQKKAYLDEANALIEKITAGITSDSADFASGVLVTNHFVPSTDTE